MPRNNSANSSTFLCPLWSDSEKGIRAVESIRQVVLIVQVIGILSIFNWYLIGTLLGIEPVTLLPAKTY